MHTIVKRVALLLTIVLFSAIAAFAKPSLTFFSQVPTTELETIYGDTLRLQQLKALNATICLGILDFSEKRAEIVKRLQEWGIPVRAQFMMGAEDNHRLTYRNVAKAQKRYEDFKQWVTEYQLSFKVISLEISPLLSDIEKLEEGQWELFFETYQRLDDSQVIVNARDGLRHLVSSMKANGYVVESFIYPFVLDAQQSGSEAFQKITGLLDVQANRKIPMFYSSYFEKQEGHKYILSYGQGQKLPAIALGSTGGELAGQGSVAPEILNLATLERDMRLAAKFTDELYIFSLEGCIAQDQLRKFSIMVWEEEVTYDVEEINKVRENMTSVLRILEHPTLLVVGVVIVLLLTIIAIWRVLSRLFS